VQALEATSNFSFSSVATRFIFHSAHIGVQNALNSGRQNRHGKKCSMCSRFSDALFQRAKHVKNKYQLFSIIQD
jgi:hypothetical protein